MIQRPPFRRNFLSHVLGRFDCRVICLVTPVNVEGVGGFLQAFPQGAPLPPTPDKRRDNSSRFDGAHGLKGDHLSGRPDEDMGD